MLKPARRTRLKIRTTENVNMLVGSNFDLRSDQQYQGLLSLIEKSLQRVLLLCMCPKRGFQAYVGSFSERELHENTSSSSSSSSSLHALRHMSWCHDGRLLGIDVKAWWNYSPCIQSQALDDAGRNQLLGLFKLQRSGQSIQDLLYFIFFLRAACEKLKLKCFGMLL